MTTKDNWMQAVFQKMGAKPIPDRFAADEVIIGMGLREGNGKGKKKYREANFSLVFVDRLSNKHVANLSLNYLSAKGLHKILGDRLKEAEDYFDGKKVKKKPKTKPKAIIPSTTYQ